jgi:hypothetical protein
MRFFLKDLNPFKIQTRFKLDLLLNFIIQNSEGLEVGPKRKILPFEFIYHHETFGFFLNHRSTIFIFCKLESFWIFGKSSDYLNGPTCLNIVAHAPNPASGPDQTPTPACFSASATRSRPDRASLSPPALLRPPALCRPTSPTCAHLSALSPRTLNIEDIFSSPSQHNAITSPVCPLALPVEAAVDVAPSSHRLPWRRVLLPAPSAVVHEWPTDGSQADAIHFPRHGHLNAADRTQGHVPELLLRPHGARWPHPRRLRPPLWHAIVSASTPTTIVIASKLRWAPDLPDGQNGLLTSSASSSARSLTTPCHRR